MSECLHVLVEQGPEKGRKFRVPPNGIRIGRSSKNDVSLNDPSLSRFHCRLSFDDQGTLCISDLGSANGTLVNNTSVDEKKLEVGDLCSLGETTLRVVHNQCEPGAAPSSSQTIADDAAVNLGLSRATKGMGSLALRRWLYAALSVMAVVTVLAWLPWNKWVNRWLTPKNTETPSPAAQEVFPAFDVSFERVEGSISNIFRYAMSIKDQVLTVQVDDLASGRHVRREKSLAPELLEDLARMCDQVGFFELSAEYLRVADNRHESTDLAITIGRRSHHVQVLNELEPEPVARIRTQLEEFSKNELGLAALAIPPEELKSRANESFLLGLKLRDEREVEAGNLARAIRAFMEAEWYLETIEPKPGFFNDLLRQRAECEQELQKRYDNLWFTAERSVKLRDWKDAAASLRLVCEMIPDRSDNRHRNAYKKLVDVDRRLATEKRP